MIFADKLIALRKKSGWSQEELASQLNVSRQSISKWEGAQSMPDLEKILRLSQLFGVSTDYLLKDDINEAETPIATQDAISLRRVSLSDVTAFLNAKQATATPIALASFLCILSLICLLLLGAASEIPNSPISETMAGGVGMIVLLALVAIAVLIFIKSGSQTAPFKYLDQEAFETEYGVVGMVKERMAAYKETYTRGNVMGAILCIVSLIPLFAGIIINENDDFFIIAMLCVMLLFIGVGAWCFIRVGIINASYQKLLQEGEYTASNKARQPLKSAVTVIYWLLIVAAYVCYSMITNNWDKAVIIYIGGGILYPALMMLLNLVNTNKR